MKIGIIGAGAIGSALARHFARIGHDVSVANSRGPKSLEAFAAELAVRAVTVESASRDNDVVVVSIPQKAVVDLSPDLFRGVPASVVVIDTNNYYPQLRDGHIAALEAGELDSVWVSSLLGRPVVKCFNNIVAASLRDGGLPRGAPGRIALSFAGDDASAKAVVSELVDAIGFDPVDAGPLSESWRQEPGTAAYCRDLSADALKAALAEAKASERAAVRTAAETALIARLKSAGLL